MWVGPYVKMGWNHWGLRTVVMHFGASPNVGTRPYGDFSKRPYAKALRSEIGLLVVGVAEGSHEMSSNE